MKSLVRKIAGLLPKLEEHGQVFFYALGEREDVNRWDVVLSSVWSDENRTEAVKLVANLLVDSLTDDELLLLAGVVIIPSSEQNIVDMPKSLEKPSADEERIVDMTMMGLQIKRVYIFASRSAQKHLFDERLEPSIAG